MSQESPKPNKVCQCIPKSAFHYMEHNVYYEYVPEGQQSITIPVLKFWSDWGSTFFEWCQRNRTLARGLCKMTKHPPTYLILLYFFFWQIMSCLWFRKNYTPWHGSLWLLAVHPNLNSTKMKEIRWHWHHQGEYNEATDDYSEILILKMFPTMAETLASMCGSEGDYFEGD